MERISEREWPEERETPTSSGETPEGESLAVQERVSYRLARLQNDEED